MDTLSALLSRDGLPAALAAALVLALLLHGVRADARATARRSIGVLLVIALAEAATVALGAALPATLAQGVHQAAVLLVGIVLVRLAGLVLFRAALPALGQPLPRIVEDLAVALGYVLWVMVRLSMSGVHLSGLVATSAVVTAVLAFAMQDTLGNVLAGLALQLDDSLDIGDWVRLDDTSGRVVEIQWRFTALRTRSGETVVVPNAQLMKARFGVLRPRGQGGAGVRRVITFDLDPGVRPSRVIEAVQQDLAGADIANVARDPAASCVLLDFPPGALRYGLRYWLLDPGPDDATDSAVRQHLLATLQRHGWRLALPDRALHLVQDDEAHRQAGVRAERERRLAALAGVELFASLDDAERRRMADRLVPAPFAAGDTITRQGAKAHWLYLLVAGEAEVHWDDPQGQRHPLGQLHAGQCFGEMGLMTGAPRSATVVATTDVECYRLDKAGFQDILHARQSLADDMARVLAQRQQQNDALHARYAAPGGAAPAPSQHAAMLQRVREFFGLD